MSATTDIIKKPYKKTEFTESQLLDLITCAEDPFHFIENHVMVQHPMRGSVQFVLREYQHELINAFHNNRWSIAMCARQLGKCLQFNTIIKKDDGQIRIGNLHKLGVVKRFVAFLENCMIKLATE